MSESDSFIDEVTEEVRRDKLYATFRKYGWIGAVAVLAIVGGAAWTEWQKSRAQAEAVAFGDAVMSAMATDDPAARLAALDGVSAEGAFGDTDGRVAVLGLLAADEALKAGDKDEAKARLAEIVAMPTLDPAYHDMAQLKWLAVAGDGVDAGERDRILADLTIPGRPYRVLALERQALVLASGGKTDEAIAALKALLQDADVPAGLRRRATQLIVALGGTPDAA